MAIPNFVEPYAASAARYENDSFFRRSGKSSIKLPRLSLGFWWNFGDLDPYHSAVERMKKAFDNGIFCFDLANNYGPAFGAAEKTFGRVYSEYFRPYRHEMIVTTKAGYNMWQGPNGNGSSRRMLVRSLEESLQRMNLDYVDIFYSHRYDGVTPIEETMQALVDVVRQGKAIYAGLSNYPIDKLKEAAEYLNAHDCPPLIYQGKYHMFWREVENDHLKYLFDNGIGFTAFSPLWQGILSNKYLNGIPSDSRVAQHKSLTEAMITPQLIAQLKALNEIASQRGQSLAQMATAWILSHKEVTSVIIGSRTVEQLEDSLRATSNTAFSDEEIAKINTIIG